jgi:hypothetical protein
MRSVPYQIFAHKYKSKMRDRVAKMLGASSICTSVYEVIVRQLKSDRNKKHWLNP